MNDVAKVAGVSRGTVSNYINGVKIKKESQKKVEQAIQELDYVPNQAARALKTQKSNYVVFILPTIWTPFFSELTYYLQLELNKCGLKMLLCNSQDDYIQELEYIRMAQEQKVTGIITISYSDITPYLTANLPIVSIERYFDDTVPFITSDNFGGGQLAAQKLQELGSQRLLMVVRKISHNLGLQERQNGFISYCQKAHMPFDVYLDEGNSAGFRARVFRFFENNYQAIIPYDGIFAATDRYADYCYDALVQKTQWHLPEDIQLIGFDGSKSYQNEALKISTIRQPVAQIAELSVAELIKLGSDRKKSKKTKYILPITFLAAQTTREKRKKNEEKKRRQ